MVLKVSKRTRIDLVPRSLAELSKDWSETQEIFFNALTWARI